jgi:hypothetical protein
MKSKSTNHTGRWISRLLLWLLLGAMRGDSLAAWPLIVSGLMLAGI